LTSVFLIGQFPSNVLLSHLDYIPNAIVEVFIGRVHFNVIREKSVEEGTFDFSNLSFTFSLYFEIIYFYLLTLFEKDIFQNSFTTLLQSVSQ
jgi:hypothetical protein